MVYFSFYCNLKIARFFCLTLYNITVFLELKFVSVRISVRDHIGALIMAGLHELMFNASNFYFSCTPRTVSTHTKQNPIVRRHKKKEPTPLAGV